MAGMTAEFCDLRALEELNASERATCPEAAAAHRQLAREFAIKAQLLRADEQTEAAPQGVFRWESSALG
ncbi:hypothetical protein ACFB49_24700 [Sphingomonas sp. DBB INV C78]